MPDLAIGIDVGATKVAAALVSGPDHTVRLLTERTPQRSGEEIVDLVANLIGELMRSPEAGGRRLPVGIGLPAQIDFSTQTVLRATNLPLGGVAVAGPLRGRFGGPLVIDNDANLAALAETRHGAAEGRRHVICLTMGTGIGGGLVFDGELYRGWLGVGAEVGHMVIELEGADCACGGRGCFETLAAGPALVRNAREAVARHPDSLLARLAGGDAGKVEGRMVTQAAREGDRVAQELFAHIGRILGYVLTSLANLLNPQIFVIGGGMVEAGEFLVGPAREIVMSCAMEPALIDLEVVAARFGNSAGYLGAATLAREHAKEKASD